ncbi:MAG: helix-turn-helix domain-containing protein [Gammaproteobacteria bacterium]|nr:helix-turn-helix domain-containing protein [Gammaproteobacteria bacterium]
MTHLVEKKNDMINNVVKHWKYIAPVIHEPLTPSDYDQLSKVLDHLLDVVGENESHELIGLVDVVSHMISLYDAHEETIESTSGVGALKFLMTQHHLRQTDLSDIASQGVLSEILNGKRKLNLNQIKKLANKFNVSVDTFID